jgi:hypothetical protein
MSFRLQGYKVRFHFKVIKIEGLANGLTIGLKIMHWNDPNVTKRAIFDQLTLEFTARTVFAFILRRVVECMGPEP